MCRFIPLLLATLALTAQTPPMSLDKPPQDIDDALRARITSFYDYHVAQKFRLCEDLIADESKDDFYVLTKPALQSYKIGNIEYSEKFTRAKVIIVGVMPVLIPMAGPRVMEQPFASYWKRENGVWFWYYNKKVLSDTPFGKAAPSATPVLGTTKSLAATTEANLEALQSALKIDRTSIEITAGQPQTVKITNTLPGPASLTIDCLLRPIAQTGISATFDKKDLKGSEAAVLTLTADPKMAGGAYPLRITVSPTNQVLDITVKVTL
jgi:hypothetical protein